ncbi:heavy-metal-associated domain-containing protein [soil metagenome]
MSNTRTLFAVSGMTCGHCAETVSEEVTKVDGVHDVAVDLSTGELAVLSEDEPDEAAVRAAVEEAGYDLVAGGSPAT